MTRSSSNGATMSGCHHKRMGNRRQVQADRELIELTLKSLVELGTPAQRREALDALRWLRTNGGQAYNPSPGGRR